MARRVRFVGVLAWALIVAVVLACGTVDFAIVTEYYGSGPPYYGRTVNMDKWTSPVSSLLLINAGGLVTIALIVATSRMVRRHRESR